ncbi:hypothetical protein [Thalassospira sp.]|uniref:hypothetical protein n=1 Tax=Thalassospira sp. TaxID=1912094 RepID=UPI003AA9916A
MSREKSNNIYLGVALGASGIADVERFFAGFKMVAGLTAILVLFSTVFYFSRPYVSRNEVNSSYVSGEQSSWERRLDFLGYFGYGYWWGKHYSWGLTYFKACVQDESFGCTKETTPFQFVLLQIKQSPRIYIDLFMFFIFWFCLGFGYFFLRRPAPMRFNRNLGAIYTWHRGKLWIHPNYIFNYDEKTGLDLLGSGGFNGPMHMKLQSSRNPKKLKTFKLGTYPFPCDGYGQFLARRLQEFMRGSYKDRDRGWPKDLKYPWWQRSVLGRKELPEDIDQRAEEWLRLHRKNEA